MTIGNRSEVYRVSRSWTLSIRSGVKTSSASSGQPITLVNVWSGVDDPKHLEKERLGISCTNTYSSRRHRLRIGRSQMQAYHAWTQYASPSSNVITSRDESDSTIRDPCSASDYVVALPNYASQLAALQNAVSGRFYSKASDAVTAFQGGVALGELKETIRLLVSPGKALKTALSDYVKKANKAIRRHQKSDPTGRKRKRLQKHLAELYLAAQFGWKPLFNDIEAARKALAEKRDLVSRVRASQTVRISELLTQTDSQAINNIRYKKSILAYGEAKVKCYGAVRTGPLDPRYPDFQKWGFSQENFLPTIWNILPWSWFIDYFSNIGVVIQAASFIQSRFVYSGVTTVQSNVKNVRVNPYISRHRHGLGYTDKETTQVYTTPMWFTMQYALVDRQVGVTIPSVSFTIPGSPWRWTNITALLVIARAGISRIHADAQGSYK